MTGRLDRFWWTAAPDATARVSRAAAAVLRDGRYLLAVPAVAAVAPLAALLGGLLIGWRHPLITDVLSTSVLFMALALVISGLSVGLGAWLMLGYALGDLLLAARSAPFTGSLPETGKTWAALLLTDAVLVVLVILLPLTARVLAAEMDERLWQGRRGIRPVALGAVTVAVLVYSWTQAALLLTRPYFTWHGQQPPRAEVDALHLAAWVLPLVAAATLVGRAQLEARLRPVPPPSSHGATTARRELPLPIGVALRVGLSVFLLAGLMDSWVDAVIVAVLMALLIVVREPALRRIGWRVGELERVPVMLRLLCGALLSAVLSVVIVGALGTGSVIRPVVVSTMLSLLVFTLLLPEHILLDEPVPAALAAPTPTNAETGAVAVPAPP